MRGILTGGAQDQGYRSVPVVSNTTVLTPNTTATVTLTCDRGEMIGAQQPKVWILYICSMNHMLLAD